MRRITGLIELLAALAVAAAACCLGAEPQVCPVGGPCPPVVKQSLTPTPAKKSLAELGAAVDAAQVALDAAIAAVNASKTVLTRAMDDAAKSQTALDAAKKALLDALNVVPPVPPEPPKPEPAPPGPLFGIVIEESSQRTPCQATVMAAPAVRALFTGGLRIVDKDAPAGLDKWVQASAGQLLPVLFLTDKKGTVFYKGALPATVPAFEKLVAEKRGGK